MWKQPFIRLARPRLNLARYAGCFRDMRQSLHRTRPAKEPAIKDTVLKAMDQTDLFKYTSGRWLIDEQHQLKQHFVEFDVDRLCRQAVSLFSKATKCVRIVKLEGNFNKAFLLSMDDGNEVIAKIPTPNAGKASLTTASEVATLRFLRSCTSIRVPEVFAWSSEPGNPVGAEYIIMEKISGTVLAERWETMDTLERYKIIDQIVAMEKELEGLKFPAYGSLYLRSSAPDGYDYHPLPHALDPTGLFCVGPSCSRSVWNQDSVDMSKPVPNVGSWTSLLEFALSISQRELDNASGPSRETELHLHRFDESQSLEEYSALLQKARSVLPILFHYQPVKETADPALWHTDLNLGNIFVSTDDPTAIEGIIDWQSTHIAPLFLQARFPEFLRPPKDYNPGTDVPSLPDNFDNLNPEQQAQAKRDKTLASQSKYYEMFCLAYNKHVYDAMKLDRRLWDPFSCCQLFSHGSLVPLRNSLARISQDWALYGLPDSCPFVLSDEESKRHDEQVVAYQDMLYLWDVVKTQLYTDESGWVPMDRWEETKNLNQSLYDMYIKTMSKEMSPDTASKKWPFPPNSS